MGQAKYMVDNSATLFHASVLFCCVFSQSIGNCGEGQSKHENMLGSHGSAFLTREQLGSHGSVSILAQVVMYGSAEQTDKQIQSSHVTTLLKQVFGCQCEVNPSILVCIKRS